MPDEPDSDLRLPSERELHGRSPETAREWALRVVNEVVEDKVRGRVWPIPVTDRNVSGYYSGHKQGWAFESLLGAMWLQMSWLMIGQARRCAWCGRLLEIDPEQEQILMTNAEKSSAFGGPRKRRNDRRFCDNKGRCRAKWHYHYGQGKSSKQHRGR